MTLAPTSTSPAMQCRHFRFNHPNHPPCLIVSNGVTGAAVIRRLMQILPKTHETIARNITTDITAKNGPIDPDDDDDGEDKLLDAATWLLLPVPAPCGGDEIADSIIKSLQLSKKQQLPIQGHLYIVNKESE